MDAKLSKLQNATDEAEAEVIRCKALLDSAENQLIIAKSKYRALPLAEQQTIQVNETELPHLIEKHSKLQDEYEVAMARLATNRRYLEAWKSKLLN